MKEFVVAGLLISPFVKYVLIAGVIYLPIRFVLVRLRFEKLFWHPFLAELAIFTCLLAWVNVLL